MSEFAVLVPAPSPTLKYTITGPDCQILSISLQPGEFAEAQPGSLMYMHPDVSTTVRLGKCSRVCAGESLCIARYTYLGGGGKQINESLLNGYVALNSDLPGTKLVPVDLNQVGGSIIVKPGSYLASYGDVSVEASVDCCSLTCCFGGLGAIRQRVKGSGTTFLVGGGTVLTRTLAPGEKIIIDDNAIVGYQESAKFNVQRTGNCCTSCCGGEGFFVSTVTGPGLVLLESMSFEKYKKSLIKPPFRPLESV